MVGDERVWGPAGTDQCRRTARARFGGGIGVERGGGDLWIVSLRGEHDLSNVADLDEALRRVHTHGTRVVLDFSEASFVDSSVIARVVREARDDARKPGDDLAVVAPAGSQPRRVLELVQVECVRIVESRDDAISAIGAATVEATCAACWSGVDRFQGLKFGPACDG